MIMMSLINVIQNRASPRAVETVTKDNSLTTNFYLRMDIYCAFSTTIYAASNCIETFSTRSEKTLEK